MEPTATVGSTSDLSSIDGSLIVAVVALLSSLGLGFFNSRQQRTSDRHEELMSLKDEYEAAEYHMRFWRLSLAIRNCVKQVNEELDPDFCDLDLLLSPLTPAPYALRNPPFPWSPAFVTEAGEPESKFTALGVRMLGRFLDVGTESIGGDLFGPPWSTYRADFYDFWMFALRTWNWVDDPDCPWWDRVLRFRRRRRKADAVTAVFGNRLIKTITDHRTAAFRLAGWAVPHDATAEQDYSQDYYRHAYGLADNRYRKLVDYLYESACRQGLLTATERYDLRRLEHNLSVSNYQEGHGVDPRQLRTTPTYISHGL